MSEAAITIGNGIPVGNVIVDPRAIKGAGSWYNPYLYIPIKIQMYARNDGEHVALIRLTASLHLTEIIDINNQFDDRVSYDLLYNIPNRSTVATIPAESEAKLLFTHGSLILKVSSPEWRASMEYTADGKPSKATMRSCKAERGVT